MIAAQNFSFVPESLEKRQACDVALRRRSRFAVHSPRFGIHCSKADTIFLMSSISIFFSFLQYHVIPRSFFCAGAVRKKEKERKRNFQLWVTIGRITNMFSNNRQMLSKFNICVSLSVSLYFNNVKKIFSLSTQFSQWVGLDRE